MKQFILNVLTELERSEYWFLIGQVVVEALTLPVPPEVKVAGWVYIGGRVLSRVAKVLIPVIKAALSKEPTNA